MLEIRNLQKDHINTIVEAFQNLGWNKPASQYERYLDEQSNNLRLILVAFENGEFAGYLTIVWESKYPPFKEAQIPEINDFIVLPDFRRKKIGTLLMNKAEEIISQEYEIVGIGVGLDADYGAAQKLYVLRGYVPDGLGIVYQNRFPKYGEKLTLDDDLNLYLTKRLK